MIHIADGSVWSDDGFLVIWPLVLSKNTRIDKGPENSFRVRQFESKKLGVMIDRSDFGQLTVNKGLEIEKTLKSIHSSGLVRTGFPVAAKTGLLWPLA